MDNYIYIQLFFISCNTTSSDSILVILFFLHINAWINTKNILWHISFSLRVDKSDMHRSTTSDDPLIFFRRETVSRALETDKRSVHKRPKGIRSMLQFAVQFPWRTVGLYDSTMREVVVAKTWQTLQQQKLQVQVQHHKQIYNRPTMQWNMAYTNCM